MRSVTRLSAHALSTSTDRISTINCCSSPGAMGTSLLGFVINTSSERAAPRCLSVVNASSQTPCWSACSPQLGNWRR